MANFVKKEKSTSLPNPKANRLMVCAFLSRNACRISCVLVTPDVAVPSVRKISISGM